MKRREFIALLGGAAAWSRTAIAQHSEGLRRIGMLLPGSTLTHGRYIAAFRRGLRELGYTEGRHFSLDVSLAEGRLDRLPSLATELAALKVDVIVSGSDEGTLAARQSTTSIPIVQGGGGDLVRLGMAQSLAHPGANVTGLNNEASDLSAKLLEMLLLMIPTVSQIGVLTNPTAPQTQSQIVNILEAGRALHVAAHIIAASERAALDDAFGALLREHLGALVVVRNALFVSNSRRIVELAASARLPVIYPFRSFVEEGGLMSYGVNLADNFRRAASFVDRILKGASPADLPVEEPTKFELVINMKTVKALGITIPPTLLARTDEVIE
jgi:putative tryptophan/tyrosine transport system substrate-binding protein